VKRLIICLFLFGAGTLAVAEDHPKSREEAEALVSTLKFQQGQVVLKDGLATLNVPQGFSYLNGADANKIVVNLWGNPPGQEPLGLLMSGTSPLSRDTWAVIITYDEDGYIKDNDAAKINYTDLLKQMKQRFQDANAERTKQGYPTIELVGWAEPPHYDSLTHKLYWAKELKFGNESANTLNYSIRMLGRRGVLVLNAVAGMNQLSEIERKTPEILTAIDFNQGNRYADFKPGSDKIATYGLAALVAGGVAAKLGFFKLIWVGILAAKKFIVVAVLAVVAWFRRLFGKKTPATPPAASS
jgi:uncharacterized membrane-anchored protein